MVDDILDTRFEGKELELKGNFVKVGDDVNITALDPGLHQLHIGVGWDLNAFDADAIDLDVSCFLLGRDGKTRMDEDFIFYNNPKDFASSVKHGGDSRTGAGDGDDEHISIDMRGVSFDVEKIVFTISIYRGEEKQQTLSKVQNAYLRLVNLESTMEICRFEMREEIEDKLETALIIGELLREGPKWHFLPKAEFIEGGLGAIAKRFGCLITQS